MKMAKETWIQGQCQKVEACLRKNNNKSVYHLVKDLTIENIVNPQRYNTSQGSVSQRRMKFLTDGPSTDQTVTTMRLMGTQECLTASRYQMKNITLFYEERWKQQSKH